MMEEEKENHDPNKCDLASSRVRNRCYFFVAVLPMWRFPFIYFFRLHGIAC